MQKHIWNVKRGKVKQNVHNLLIVIFLFFSPSTVVVLNARIIKRAMRVLKNANVQLVLQDHNVKLVMMLYVP